MQFIFRKDLTHCPVFSKLKTLLLNDWCITGNLGPLICFLQHSPTLEKLTLQLPEVRDFCVTAYLFELSMHGGFNLFCIFWKVPEDVNEMEGTYDVNKQPFASKRLTVEVKCHKPDERVRKILEVLGSCGISPEQIKVLQSPKQIKSRCKDFWPPGSKLNTENLFRFYASAIFYICVCMK